VGTFGLGCWQLERLLEKWDAIEDREQQLKLNPIRYGSTLSSVTVDNSNSTMPYRQRLLRGSFRHDKEVLLGPRGAPLGVRLPVSGLSAKNSSSKTTASGMQPGPQGFYVLTPMEVVPVDDEPTSTTTSEAPSTVWVNRGWIPKTLVPGADRPYYKNDMVQKAKIDRLMKERPAAWNRPKGIVEVKAVLSQAEKPRFITPEHDYSKRPLQLFWVDGLALKAIAAELYTPEELESNTEVAMVTQVVEDDETSGESNKGSLLYPLQPPVSSIGNFKTTPATHMGYAATWFGLSGAGLYMTRKLITKGRY